MGASILLSASSDDRSDCGLPPLTDRCSGISPGAESQPRIVSQALTLINPLRQQGLGPYRRGAFARLIRLVKRSSRDERNQARVRLLELFEMLRNGDERVLKAHRDLITALF